MSSQFVVVERAYEDLLASLWDELEDLLDAYYGRLGCVPWGLDRLRLKIVEFRARLARLHDQVTPFIGRSGHAGDEAPLLERFSAELMRLLEVDSDDPDFDLSCGPTMVRAQNRILEEVRRLALPR